MANKAFQHRCGFASTGQFVSCAYVVLLRKSIPQRPTYKLPLNLALNFHMRKITCKFEFECSKKWSELKATDKENVKFCLACNHEVYLAGSQKEFDQFAADGKCVAIEEAGWDILGMPEARPIIEYSLYIPKQSIFGEKLKSLRDLLNPELSLAEAKVIFHSKSVKIESITKEYAEELNSSLKALEINSEVQSKKI